MVYLHKGFDHGATLLVTLPSLSSSVTVSLTTSILSAPSSSAPSKPELSKPSSSTPTVSPSSILPPTFLTTATNPPPATLSPTFGLITCTHSPSPLSLTTFTSQALPPAPLSGIVSLAKLVGNSNTLSNLTFCPLFK